MKSAPIGVRTKGDDQTHRIDPFPKSFYFMDKFPVEP
jgi:hypothetical protein